MIAAAAIIAPATASAAASTAYVADNYEPLSARYVSKPSTWRVYPDNRALCCGMTLEKLRWRDWTRANAYATARWHFRTYEPWQGVKVRVYGRRLLRHGTYAYTRVAVTVADGRTTRWTLDPVHSEPRQ